LFILAVNLAVIQPAQAPRICCMPCILFPSCAWVRAWAFGCYQPQDDTSCAGEGESVEGAARSSEDVQLPSSSRGPSQEASQELEPCEEGPGLFAQPRPRRPKYVTPVDELDESDAEAAQVHHCSQIEDLTSWKRSFDWCRQLTATQAAIECTIQGMLLSLCVGYAHRRCTLYCSSQQLPTRLIASLLDLPC
jgi:hypothetical protein